MHTLVLSPSRLSPLQREMRVRVCMLLLVLAGLMLSSLGLTRSHGLAELASTGHQACLPASHCVHEEADHATQADAALQVSTQHDHHTGDHSHDKAQMLAKQSPPTHVRSHSWGGHAPAWMPDTALVRLERPPKN